MTMGRSHSLNGHTFGPYHYAGMGNTERECLTCHFRQDERLEDDRVPPCTSGRVPSPCEVTGDRHLTDCACRPADDGRMDSYGTPTGWFADLADEEERDERMPWQPFLQASGGCFPLPLWFATESACQDWIRAHVIGNGWLVNHIRNYGEPSDA